ncbi:MAG: hypothetical protein NTZ09_09010, partial [Candidatus Hydrogenedentes bacterium]|nr:hypothetical protein [Candidatus Hydrogenedentota bacterium]
QDRTAAYYALVVFAVACATLGLQIIQTRVYAFVFWNHLVYFIISIALLGFGVSGTWLAFGKQTRLARLLTLELAAVAFVVTALISTLLVPQLRFSVGALLKNEWQLVRLMLTYGTAVLPYFFSGWVLGVIYRDHAEHIHSLYFFDLIGAGAGCLLVLGLIRPIGAVGLVQVMCLLVAAPILAGRFTLTRKPHALIVLAVITVTCVALFFARKYIETGYLPDESKAFSVSLAAADRRPAVEFTEWNSIARTDVIGSKTDPQKRIFIDGDAWTDMAVGSTAGVPEPFNLATELYLPQRLPYLLGRPLDDVLVIGSGGGRNVWSSLRAGARHVDAVEINPSTTHMLVNQYRQATHGLFLRPDVTLWNEEGRSFLRRRTQKYDVITLNAIDTFAALDAGAYMLSENYLYTLDAILDYVNHLKPNGILNITRWDYAGETPRLFATMLEALYVLGYQNPDQHIVSASRDFWTAVIISPTPFTPAETQAVRQQCDRFDGKFYFPLAAEQRTLDFQVDLNAYSEARAGGNQKQFIKNYFYNITPVTDDSPFFFHYEKARNMFRIFSESYAFDFMRGHWPSFTLYILTVLLTLALVFFVFLPLLRRGRAPLPQFGLWILYFCCLGFAFIFVEISLMQRFALLLGHPARSLALVLASLLIFAGLGSYSKERFGLNLTVALALLVAAILAAAFVYPRIETRMLGLSLELRGLITVILVFPAAFFMGMPFPAGIKIVQRLGSDAVPWMLGVNGGATVLGSILAISCAIAFNFTTVLVMAAAGYALALLLHALLKKTT